MKRTRSNYTRKHDATHAYSSARVRYPCVRGPLLEMWREIGAPH